MVSLTSAAAGIEFRRSANSRNTGNSQRSRLFDTSNHDQHRSDRHERQSDQHESESCNCYRISRQQLDHSVRSELDDHEQYKFNRRKSEQYESDRRHGNVGQYEFSGQ